VATKITENIISRKLQLISDYGFYFDRRNHTAFIVASIAWMAFLLVEQTAQAQFFVKPQEAPVTEAEIIAEGEAATLLRTLKGVTVPEPSNLNQFVRDRQAAIALGKAAANVYLQNFVNELIETGFVASSIEKHQIKGLKAISA
jgi:hypothetical protein